MAIWVYLGTENSISEQATGKLTSSRERGGNFIIRGIVSQRRQILREMADSGGKIQSSSKCLFPQVSRNDSRDYLLQCCWATLLLSDYRVYWKFYPYEKVRVKKTTYINSHLWAQNDPPPQGIALLCSNLLLAMLLCRVFFIIWQRPL